MRLHARLASAWRTLFRSRALERDLDDELRAAIDTLTDRYVAAGLPLAAARRAALLDLGGVDQVKEQVRDGRAGSWLVSTLADVRYAVRLLRRSPGFATVIVLTLAIGIGANTAIFGIVRTMLLAPLPYRDADRLLFVWSDMTEAGYPRAPLSGPELTDLRDTSVTCSAFAAIWSNTAALTGDNDPEQLRIGLVTDNFFDVLGASPALGRTFLPDDGRPGPPPSIVLSWSLFSRRYGGDPALIGRQILVNDRPTIVVGVMPPRFRLLLPQDASVPDDLQAWLPFQSTIGRGPRGQQYLRVIGRMRPGVTVAQARDDISAIAARISREYAEYSPGGRVFTTVALHDDSVREIRPALIALFGGVTILLLITCVNVANLLIARTAARRPEIALRLALGASRGRIVRQTMTEGLLLAGAGAAGGIAVAALMLKGLTTLRPEAMSRIDFAAIDVPVLLFALGSATAWGILFSLAPVLETFRAQLSPLVAGQRRDGSPALHYRTRAALVIVQIALSVVLLVSAGLIARTFVRILTVEPGFRPDGVLTFRMAIPMQRYRPREGFNTFAREVEQRLLAIRGVTGAGAISHLPFDDLPNWGGPYRLPGTADRADAPDADYRTVTPGTLEVLGVPLVDGRYFTEADQDRPVAILDEKLAKRLWPDQSAVGKQLLVDPGSTGHALVPATVVGVVPHLRLRSLVADLTEQVYFPQRVVLRNPMAYVVRTSGAAGDVAADVRSAIHALDPRLPIYDVRSMQEYVDAARATRRFTLVLAGTFAFAALALAGIGIYGVLAYAVARRRHEFGVRLALGAAPALLVRGVMREGARLVAIGGVAGIAGAGAVAALMRSQLYGVTAADPIAFGGTLALLGLTSAIAAWIPARRATAVDPALVLRD